MDHVYEVIVIGAGVEGSSTSYYLTSRHTSNVLLLEQFDRGHARGSSHGGSRLTRRSLQGGLTFTMMDEALRLWKEIEAKGETDLYNKCGLIIFGDEHVTDFVIPLAANNAPHQLMSGREANERFPQQLKLPDDYLCLYEEDGGLLKAAKAVATLQSLFVRQGGDFRDNHKVTGLLPGTIVTVQTDKGDFRAKRVIITAGAWTNKVLQPTGLSLPLKVERTEVLYWNTDDPKAFHISNFPTFKYIAGDSYNATQMYGMPCPEYPGLFKACYHFGPEVDPDKRDINPYSYTAEETSKFVQKHFKGLSKKPAIIEFCMYTVTADRNPILDRHPVFPNIVFGAGFSGSGFKIAPIVGKILSELAMDQPSCYNLMPFKASRFKGPMSNL